MMRDSLQFGTAEEQAINQYLRDKAEDEISTSDNRFHDWLLDNYELSSEPIRVIVVSAVIAQHNSLAAAERIRDAYIEHRIENADARADAYRALFENQTEPME